MYWLKRIFGLSLFILLFAFPFPMFAVDKTVSKQMVADDGPGDITPAHVFMHVTRAHRELDLIRKEMGMPKINVSGIVVRNAAPREVFYHALTLFRKANRFSFEQIRIERAETPTPKGIIYPRHVFAMVDEAMQMILGVKTSLEIDEVIEQPTLDATLTPSDVFLNIISLNRQLNRMLDKRFAPKDVFQRVSLAIGYSAKLLAQFPDSKRIPLAEIRQRGKTPSDVFYRLVRSYAIIRDIGTRSGLNMLEMDVTGIDNRLIVPSDVYDIASLMVSELAHVHAQLKDKMPPRAVYNPGRKFSSHVYQRVGILEAQLLELNTRVGNSSDWLSFANGR